jgi:hypothetical protein
MKTQVERLLYRSHFYRGDTLVRVTVWNGVENYSNDLPDWILHDRRFVGEGTVEIFMVGNQVGSMRKHLAELPVDAIIVWSRDTETYFSVVEEIGSHA